MIVVFAAFIQCCRP